MDDPVRYLTLQFLQWVDEKPRSYRDAMDAWRTSCPRLPVWEDAISLGLVRREAAATLNDAQIVLTDRGREALKTTHIPMVKRTVPLRTRAR
jgi:hypothetical protein